MTAQEKRKYRRLDLGIEDGYFGNFQLTDGVTIVAPIINLSAGGLNMAASEKDQNKVNEGDILTMTSIIGGTNLSFLDEIKAEIRWVKKLSKTGYVSVGCRFMEIEDAVRQQLVKFVDSERYTRGQYD